MTDDAIRPFLSTVPTATRPLGAMLPALVTPEVLSPWSPRVHVDTSAPAGSSVAELATAFDGAREQGRADGLAETAALRGRLTDLVAQLTAARAAIVPPAAELIAEVATLVVETWLGNTDRRELFAPIVSGWLARSSDQPATVRVHPEDTAAFAEAIGDAPLTITADPALAPGAVEIRGSALELSHDWPARLADLRTAIVAALTGGEP